MIDFTKFQGTYKGFGPTDESPIGMGELEVIIDSESMNVRHAAGFRIDEEKMPLSQFKPMSKKELSTVYDPGSEYIDRSVGYSIGNMKFVFLPDANDEEMGLYVEGNEMSDILGPTFLFNPDQIKRGVYDKAAGSLNKYYSEKYPKGCFPTLAAGGKMPE